MKLTKYYIVKSNTKRLLFLLGLGVSTLVCWASHSEMNRSLSYQWKESDRSSTLENVAQSAYSMLENCDKDRWQNFARIDASTKVRVEQSSYTSNTISRRVRKLNGILKMPLILARNDLDTAVQNTPLTIDVLGNDSISLSQMDTAGMQIYPTPTSGNGTVSFNTDGRVTYIPAVSFSGIDSLQYVVCDTTSAPNTICDTASIFIVVLPDNDGDGIADYVDIDDDNDGILDAIECPDSDKILYSDWSGWIPGSLKGTVPYSTGGVVTIDLAKTYTNAGVNTAYTTVPPHPFHIDGAAISGAWAGAAFQAAYPAGPADDVNGLILEKSILVGDGPFIQEIEFDFTTTTTGGTDEYAAIGFAGVYPDNRPFNAEVLIYAYKENGELETDYTEWTVIESDVTTLTSTGAVFEVPWESITPTKSGIVLDPGTSPRYNGRNDSRYIQVHPSSTVYSKIILQRQLVTTSAYDAEYWLIALGYHNIPRISCPDTDRDNIADFLDLDSDGDGCYDSYEAGVRGATVNGSVRDSLAIITTNTKGVGANGFANALEENEDGIYKGSYTYANAIDKAVITCPEPCADPDKYADDCDFDGDGVLNMYDVDDDNDGVLDTEECRIIYGQTARQTGGVTNLVSAEGAPDGQSANLRSRDVLTLDLGTTISFSTDDLIRFTIGKNNIAGSMDIDFSADNRTYVQGIHYVSNADIGVLETITYIPTIKDIRYIRFTRRTGWNVVDAVTVIICSQDIDGDNIPNRLDLDSDGDGCYDSYEAGVAGATADGSVTDSLTIVTTDTTGVGANGFANVLERNENGVYVGIYTYVNAGDTAIISCPQPCSEAKDLLTDACDFDGDGIDNRTDIDDDNDGILDVVECPVLPGIIEPMSDAFNWTDGETAVFVIGNNTNALGYQESGFQKEAHLRGRALEVLNGANDFIANQTTNAATSTVDFSNGTISFSTSYITTRESQFRTTTGAAFVSGNTGSAVYVFPEKGGVAGDFYTVSIDFTTAVTAFSLDIVDGFDTLLDGNPNLDYSVYADGTLIASIRGLVVGDDLTAPLNLYDGNNNLIGNINTGQNIENSIGFVTDTPVRNVSVRHEITSGSILPTARDPHGLDMFAFSTDTKCTNDKNIDSDGDGCLDAYEAGHGIAIQDNVIIGPYGFNGFADTLETGTDSGLPNYTITATNMGIADYLDSLISNACLMPKIIAIKDLVTANENNTKTIIVLANDTIQDSQIDTASMQIYSMPTSGGTSNLNPDGTITYTPPMNFIGMDTLKYIVCDTTSAPNTLCDTTLVSITVLGDRDKDGIPDIIDLDDDNDGVLDWDECDSYEVTFAFNAAISTTEKLIYEARIDGVRETITLTPSTNPQSLLNADGIAQPNATEFDIVGNVGIVKMIDDTLRESALNIATSLPIGYVKFVDLDDMDRKDVDLPTDAIGFSTAGYWEVISGDLAVYEPTNGNLVTNNPAGNAALTLAATNGDATEMLLKNALSGVLVRGTLGETNNGQANFVASAPFTSTDLLVEDLSLFGGREFIRNVFNLEFITVGIPICDPDNDGIPNYFDLDSDGDGCADAIEAGHGEPMQMDSTIAGPYGINGAAATIETDDTRTAVSNYSLSETNTGTYDFMDKAIRNACDKIITLDLKVMLQGAMIGASDGLMRDDLRAQNFVPLMTPYTSGFNTTGRFTHVGGGDETTSSSLLLNDIGQNSIVDWLFVELRDPSDSTIVFQTISTLVERDGDVVESTTGRPLQLTNPPDSFYVSVKHRNHLGVMTARPILPVNDTTTVDFTRMALRDIYTTTGYETVPVANVVGKNALWAGNANKDRKSKYDGAANDRIIIANEILTEANNSAFTLNFANTRGYYQGDINMDGVVRYDGETNDRILLQNIVLTYPLNFSNLIVNNYNTMVEQVP